MNLCKKAPGILQRFLTGLMICGCLLFAVRTLLASLYAFSGQNFLMSDYGNYTNTLWNLAHGNGFSFLVDQNYLRTHLSFSLWALTPFVHVWDSPFLLIVVQWGFLMGGAGLLHHTMNRLRLPSLLRWPVLLFFIASPFTQSVMLSEFHFVSAYLLLIPLMFYCMRFHPGWTFLPWLLVLGMREDAGLLLPAFLAYTARRHSWKTGYLLAVLSVIYALFAIFWLYPELNGVPLFAVRKSEAGIDSILATLQGDHLRARLEATLWFAAAFLPFLCLQLRKGWIPLLLFPALPYLIAMASGYPRQHSLSFHYPAALIALTAVAMVEACSGGGSVTSHDTRPRPGRRLGFALLMLTVLLVSHLERGFFLYGGHSHPVYQNRDPTGRAVYHLAREIPGDGILLASQWLAPFAANRADITTWRHWGEAELSPITFFFLNELEAQADPARAVMAMLREGSAGVWRQAYPYLVIKRGHDPTENAAVLERIDRPTLPFALMPYCHDVALDGGNLVAYWEGNGSKAPLPITHGHVVQLDPGEYVAHFRLKAASPERDVRHHWGKLGIFPAAGRHALTEKEIEPVAHLDGEYRIQSVPFTLNTAREIEVRTTGGDAELWLKQVSFERMERSFDLAQGLRELGK
jgi:uncharacterized membrane protein